MYILCPSCNTTFVVGDDAQELRGKKLKCSKCGCVWNAFVKEASKDSKLTNLPAIIPSTYGVLHYVIVVILMCIIYMGLLYSLRSITDDRVKDLILEVAEIKDEEEKLTVYYRVLNNSDAPKEIPFTKIKLLNSDGEIVESRIFDNNISIDPKKYALVMYEFDDLHDDIEGIEVMVGTKIGLILQELMQ